MATVLPYDKGQGSLEESGDLADAILASDWLTKREAAARAAGAAEERAQIVAWLRNYCRIMTDEGTQARVMLADAADAITERNGQ
jgi:hypothetical protein